MVPYTVLISGVRPFRSRIDPGLGWQNWPADPEAGSRRRTPFQDRSFMRLCGTRSRRSGQGKTNVWNKAPLASKESHKSFCHFVTGLKNL